MLRWPRQTAPAGAILRGIGKGDKRFAVQVPEELQPRLQALAAGRDATEVLFKIHWNTVNNTLARLCRAAGCPRVTAHGLRGSHASWAREIGLQAAAVAEYLGHSERVHARHYPTGDAVQRGAQARVLQVLQGGRR